MNFPAALALLAIAPLDAGRYLQDIQFLSSPELQGRAAGSPGLESAARYIEGRFRTAGLKTSRQSFPITTGARLGRSNGLEFSDGGEPEILVVEKDFVPLNFSASGKTSGAVVFAGYGITAPEYRYDDYAGLDVRGRFALVLAREPQEYDPKSVFAGRSYTIHSQLYVKAANARAHGARGVIVIAAELEPFASDGPAGAGLPVIEVKEEVAKRWFTAPGRDLHTLEMAIDGDLKPRSFTLGGVEIRENINIESMVSTADNVMGWLPGSKENYLVLGAHYDHLGEGYPGADDNASGTTGLLALARLFGSMPKPADGILFIAFAGEELGLLGSAFYVDHPPEAACKSGCDDQSRHDWARA